MIEHDDGRDEGEGGTGRHDRCRHCGASVRAAPASRRGGEATSRRGDDPDRDRAPQREALRGAHGEEERRSAVSERRGRRDGAGFLGLGPTGRAIGAGALVAGGLLLLAANRHRLKTAVKATVREYDRFSDWLGTNLAQLKEDVGDMAAEARHEREEETARYLEMLEKERDLARRLANLAKKRAEES